MRVCKTFQNIQSSDFRVDSKCDEIYHLSEGVFLWRHIEPKIVENLASNFFVSSLPKKFKSKIGLSPCELKSSFEFNHAKGHVK